MDKHPLGDYVSKKRLTKLPAPVEPLMLAVKDPLNVARLSRPARIRLAGDRIEWSVATTQTTDASWEHAEFDDNLLGEFIALATEPDANEFFRFARKYGVLIVREDEGHWLACTEETEAEPPRVAGVPGWYWEPITAWRAVAHHFGAILTFASYLKQWQLVPRDDWETGTELLETGDEFSRTTDRRDFTRSLYLASALDSHTKPVDVAPFDASAYLVYMRQTEYVSSSVSRILKAAALTPAVSWSGAGAVVTLSFDRYWTATTYTPVEAPSLFTVLAMQLAAALAPGVNLARCERCGGTYETKRRARVDQPHYCDRCRAIVRRKTIRESARRSRAAKRAFDRHADSQEG